MRLISAVTTIFLWIFATNQVCWSQNSYEAIVTDLNTKEIVVLSSNKIFYLDLIGKNGLLSGQIESVDKNRLKVNNQWIPFNQIGGISEQKFKRHNGLIKVCKTLCFLSGTAFGVGLLMSSSAGDWDKAENSYAGKAAAFALPILAPCSAVLLLKRGPKYDFLTKHLLESRETP